MAEIGEALLKHIDAIHIGTDPNATLLVAIKRAEGVVADRRTVVFLSQELAHLMRLAVNKKESCMVGSYPNALFVIRTNIPNAQSVRQFHAPTFRQFFIGKNPTSFRLHKTACHGYHPEITIGIGTQLTFLIVDESFLTNISIFPTNPVFLSVETEHFTIE